MRTVVIITGFAAPGMREKCIAAGAVAYLVKPLERSKFSAVIQMAYWRLAAGPRKA